MEVIFRYKMAFMTTDIYKPHYKKAYFCQPRSVQTHTSLRKLRRLVIACAVRLDSCIIWTVDAAFHDSAVDSGLRIAFMFMVEERFLDVQPKMTPG